MIFKKFAKKMEEREYVEMVEDLNSGLSRLSFLDNFSSYFAQNISIASGSEVQIKHDLNNIASFYIVVRQSGDATIIDGDTTWTSDSIYLKNPSVSNAVVSLFIFK